MRLDLSLGLLLVALQKACSADGERSIGWNARRFALHLIQTTLCCAGGNGSTVSADG